MTSAPTTARAEADRCPGVLRPHRAADGALLRLRVPGGRLTAETLGAISAAAVRHADGELQLTSRANLQLRGVATDSAGGVAAGLVDEVVAAGFLPQPSHERVRNIVCSPLTGLLGGLADLSGATRLLDEKLCAATDLAALPGPFLFVLDDGRGDVVGSPADLGVCAVDAEGVRLRVGALLVGPVLSPGAAVEQLTELASRFLPFTGGERPVWHVRELPLGGRELLPPSWAVDQLTLSTGQPAPLGRLTQDDGRNLLSVLVPLGLLTADQSGALVAVARSGAGQLVVTPWRGVLVPGLPADGVAGATERLVEVGLDVGDGSAWRGITACTGAPRCAHGQGETRPLATALANLRRSIGTAVPAVPVHLVGCGRRCGSPNTEHTEVLTSGARVEIRRGGAVLELSMADAPAVLARSTR